MTETEKLAIANEIQSEATETAKNFIQRNLEFLTDATKKHAELLSEEDEMEEPDNMGFCFALGKSAFLTYERCCEILGIKPELQIYNFLLASAILEADKMRQ